MGKLQSVMAGVFLGGVLLGGVGTGIAMVEYSTLSYGGEHLMGEDYLVTKNLDFDFPQDGRMLILENGYYSYDGYGDVDIVADDSVPVGMVRYEVIYNEKTARPELIFQEYEEDDQPPEQEAVPGDENANDAKQEAEPGREKEPVYLGMLLFRVYNHEDGFMTLMENKDRFLEELKEKKISSYRQTYVTDVKVKVNPQTMPFVRNREDGYRY